jgi:hypothetical protein
MAASVMSPGGGLIGGGIGSLFGGYKDPSKEAMGHLDNIPDQLRRYFDPYINRGNQMGDLLQGEYGDLINDPGGRLNEIGGGYQQSPGFQFAMQQALQGAGNASAAGGMAGSPQHTQQNMELATNLANQDYNTWIQNALGLHGRGMGGAENMYGIGAEAGMGLGQNLASIEAQKARLAFESANSRNQQRGGIGGMIGGGLGMMAGGPIGGAIGRFLGG